MGWTTKAAVDNGHFDFGGAGQLFQTGDISIGGWINVSTAAASAAIAAGRNDILFAKNNSFFGLACVLVEVTVDATNGVGLRCGHVSGGAFYDFVSCIPGAVDPVYKLVPGAWRYFGFSRAGLTYSSYFGSRSAMFDGPVHVATHGLAGIDGGGVFAVGQDTINETFGPFSYWKRALSKLEHQQLAQCTLPSDGGDLLIWCKALNPITDLSSFHWSVNVTTPIIYVPDNGCASFGGGQDYRLRSN